MTDKKQPVITITDFNQEEEGEVLYMMCFDQQSVSSQYVSSLNKIVYYLRISDKCSCVHVGASIQLLFKGFVGVHQRRKKSRRKQRSPKQSFLQSIIKIVISMMKILISQIIRYFIEWLLG